MESIGAVAVVCVCLGMIAGFLGYILKTLLEIVFYASEILKHLDKGEMLKREEELQKSRQEHAEWQEQLIQAGMVTSDAPQRTREDALRGGS